MFRTLREDMRVVMERDPAVKSKLEILLCYPGFHAVRMHRLAHALYRRRFYLLARLISQWTRWWTGIEIHPGAKIGRGLFIDHGAGVVIGETAEIGDDVTLYQGVTLGGTGKEKGKRHPTIGNGVMIAAGATVLGNITVGDRAKIGAGAVVVRSVPPDSTVVGVPGKVVRRAGMRTGIDLDHGDLPDPVAETLQRLQREVEELKQEVSRLKEAQRRIDVDQPA